MSDESDDPGRPEREPEGVPDELRELGHYELLEELGRGAQGVVYLAEDTRLRRKVALKMLTAAGARSDIARDRFRREAEVTSKLDHPGICGVHEVGEENGVPFIAMQYVHGTTLADLLDDARRQARGDESRQPKTAATTLTGKDAVQDVLLLIERAARSLHAAHEVDLIHRDIKPANIMVTPEGKPVLLDFGLARDTEDHGSTLTETGQIMGTPAYMAAEQILGRRDEIDRKTDVYGLGATLYECLTLRPPFEAQGFDQLYHSILNGTPLNPRKLNPRIPPDLATIIEVALERDRSRRYASALDLAEDLRRLRAFEPIMAKPAGLVTRARKWSHRHPAKAVGIAAVSLFALVAAGVVVNDRVTRRRAARGHLARAETLAASGDYSKALQAVAQATERDPDLIKAVEVKARLERERDQAAVVERKAADFAGAVDARAESERKQQEFAVLDASISALEGDLRRDRAVAFGEYAPDAVRGEFARKERELEALRLDAGRLLEEAREALERAARLEEPWGRTPATDAAFASYFLDRWRAAVRAEDATRTALFQAAVERHDAAGEHRAELVGRGTIAIAVEPADAEAYLFRYEPYDSLRPGDPIPRLVPVPTMGVGFTRDGAWLEDFYPGDLCLRITGVEPGSLAENADLHPGDLIVRLAGQPAGDGLFVTSVRPDGSLAEAGITAPARITSLNGLPIAGQLDWSLVPPAEGGDPDWVTFHGEEGDVACDRRDLVVGKPEDLVMQSTGAVPLELRCLRGGELVTVEIPAGERAGIRCEPTGYPLICAPENRIHPDSTIAADPGSYLLIVKAGGFEDQRYPFVVPRLAEVRPNVVLLPEGSTPEGFVYVPPGPFLSGGDPLAMEPSPETELDLPGFFIGRREVTNREWFEFVEDPDTQRTINASSRPIYVPRQSNGPMPKQNLGGPSTPVMGISWNDARDYLAWRNAKAEENGEPWYYDLPTEHEWEKAARGVDGRAFPWGDRFDYAVVVGLHSKGRDLYDAPGGFEPRDESPFGLQDAGGHRQEWTKDPFVTDPKAPPIYRWRGGFWRASRVEFFRSASRGYGAANYAAAIVGCRLVARPRD